jgi:arylsulfatase A-like enzyme
MIGKMRFKSSNAWKICAVALGAAVSPAVHAADPARPNVVYFMADELGYFEPGFAGNRNIQTPNLDRMAAEGIRLTQCMAGSAVCAPTRCCFLTGKHSGHTSVRSNGGGTPLRAEEATIASMLKPLGYATGGFGKWGVGGRGSTGVPEQHGFDVFVGYYDQVHAHAYYPPYLIRNSEELPLAGNTGGAKVTYSHYTIYSNAARFIRENKDRPFFAFLPFTPPHGNFEIPDEDPAWAVYRDKPWPEQARRYAAMVTMLDRQVGEVLALLKELGLDEKTLVMFSGDNGGADYFASKEHPRGVHSANKDPKTGVEFRGHKGDLYEGGLRIPAIARWPGKIRPGSTSDLLCYFPDMLPTIAEVAGVKAPTDIDGISILPTLLGEAAAGRKQELHEYLYWEIGNQIAVRQGTWKAVQIKDRWELFDLAKDISETKDLSKERPAILERLKGFATAAHTPVQEGKFASTEAHERDRRAKFMNAPGGAPEQVRKKGGVGLNVPGLLPAKEMKLVRVSSENVANEKFARNAIDGDVSTLWHTKFTGGIAPPPHELVIDLGAERDVRGFVYLARQDGGWNGAVKDVEFCVASSPDGFGTPVAKKSLEKSREPQVVPCMPVKARYVMLRALSEQDGRDFASCAEFGVIGE